ncbi:MAG TPA: M24 family metallopeptidase, partial [bacterium]|nr:M24 family metallopeptidase [bacterium]
TLDSCTIISNTLYEEALGEHYEGAVHICRQPFGQELQLLCRDKQITQLWFEGRSLSAAQFLHLKQVSKVPLVQSGDLVERMRERKDREEIQLLQQACAITDAALVAVFKCLQVGMSEQEVAWMVERQIRELGSEDISFRPLIVAAGKHSAEPHHLPSEYRIATGDMVQFDIGARFQGYAADLSRVACAGAPGQEQLQVYQLVRRVQQFAIESITVGCQGAEIDRRCKEMIEKEGYAPYAHGLGHGVGL